MAGIVKVYDFNGTYIKQIVLSNSYNKITSDGTYLYLSSSSKVSVYSIADDEIVTDINVSNIQSVAVKSGYIYIVTDSKVKKYNSSGTLQSEFSISGTVEDCVII